MSGKDLSPRLSLETVLTQEPTKQTSLQRLFCPLCGLRALTEKDGPGVFRVSCLACKRAAVVQLGEESMAQRRLVDSTCPRCGHVHQGDRECGEQMGGGRICRCELEVSA